MINGLLTNRLRGIIKSRNLYDTGKMANTTTVDVTTTETRTIINILTTDYFKYLTVDYSILAEFTNSQELATVISEEYVKVLERDVQNIIEQKKVNSIFNYQPLLLINGA